MALVAKDKGAYGEGVTRFKVRFDGISICCRFLFSDDERKRW